MVAWVVLSLMLFIVNLIFFKKEKKAANISASENILHFYNVYLRSLFSFIFHFITIFYSRSIINFSDTIIDWLNWLSNSFIHQTVHKEGKLHFCLHDREQIVQYASHLCNYSQWSITSYATYQTRISSHWLFSTIRKRKKKLKIEIHTSVWKSRHLFIACYTYRLSATILNSFFIHEISLITQ
jgi:hypothetical protein